MAEALLWFGVNKPYHDNRGIVWVKNGADKRKVFDNAELAEMMTDCGSFSPDEAGVRDATIKDLDENTIKNFLSNKFEKVLVRKGLVGDAFRETSLDAVCSAIASGHDGESCCVTYVSSDPMEKSQWLQCCCLASTLSVGFLQ